MFDKLAAPFPPNVVSWRVGPTNAAKTQGMALAFIDARDVMERLDEVCGPAGWQNRYMIEGTKTVCEIGIKCGDEWIWKADGAGDSDMEAEKGALSDALKRAAVRWGIGRYLYDLDTPWVDIEKKGNSYFITKSEKARLAGILGAKPTVPADIDEPRQTQQGTKTKADSIRNAREWVNAEALPAIAKLKTKEEYNAWNQANTKILDKLKTILPDEHDAVEARLSKKLDQLEPLAAG